MAHIFHAGFITPKQKFWCEEAFDVAGNEIPPPWNVEYKHNDSYTTNVDVWPNMTNDDDTKVLGHCVPGCVNYEFDPEQILCIADFRGYDNRRDDEQLVQAFFFNALPAY